jgi:transcription elongation factor GreA
MQLPKRKSRLNRRTDPADNFLTAAALSQAESDLRSLEARRPKAVEELSAARDMGDLSENAAYTEAKARLARMDTAIFHLKERIKNAVVIESGAGPDGRARIGATVTVEVGGRTKTYAITGGQESDPAQGRISHVSPLGQALIGRRAGDTVTVKGPTGAEIEYKVMHVE